MHGSESTRIMQSDRIPIANLSVVSSKDDIHLVFHRKIIQACKVAIEDHGSFSIALSGGSVPNFLRGLPNSFQLAKVDPHFNKWHVCLADERLVPLDHPDSNYKLIVDTLNQDEAFHIPPDQVYGIDESLLSDDFLNDEKIADDYKERVILPLIRNSGEIHSDENASQLTRSLDCVVLGFGPDGHTCSLFPDHQLLYETSKFVASIADSPKPPPRRITLTLPVVRSAATILVCGSGSEKKQIVKECFQPNKNAPCLKALCPAEGGVDERLYENIPLVQPPPYPIAMVHAHSDNAIVHWIIDKDASEDLEKEMTWASSKI